MTNSVARTLLDLRETWENSTKAERKELVHIMIHKVGFEVTIERFLLVKARPDYGPLFSILDGMRHDADRRFWIERLEATKDNCDIKDDMGQMSTGVKIALSMSHNSLTIIKDEIQW